MTAPICTCDIKRSTHSKTGALSLACLVMVMLALPVNAWSDTRPRSWIELHFLSGSVTLDLRLPVRDLADAAHIPSLKSEDASLNVTGPLADYIEERVRAFATDGSIWSVRVRSLSRQPGPSGGYISAELVMRPPAAMPSDVFRFDYDVILREFPAHTSLLLVASDWKNGIFSEQRLLIGVLQGPTASMLVDRSPSLPGVLRMLGAAMSHFASQVPGSVGVLLLSLLAATLAARLLARGPLPASVRTMLAYLFLAIRRNRPSLQPPYSAPEVRRLPFHSTRGSSWLHD